MKEVEERKKWDKFRGITLVALVVTIVVLLILAGITISYIIGDNSVFKKASDAKVQTELGKIEERANLIYTDKLMQNVPNSLENKPTMQEIIEKLKTEGYKIEQVAVSGDAITGISLSRETMTLGFGGSNTIKVTLLDENNNDGYTYYALVDGKYYRIYYNNENVIIDRTPTEIASGGEIPILTASISDETVATAILDNSTNIVNVIANDSKEGTITITVTYGSYTKTCNLIVKDMPISTALEMNSIRARIAVGYTRWLSAMTTPVDALQELEWSSSDESIATVDDKGVVTAKKAGTATIKAKTIDGSNKEGTCKVTVVENAPDVVTLTEFQTANTVAKDVNGNLITVPGDFKVLASEGTKVTEGIVIQDRDGNEFVWVPIDSVSTGTSKMADDVRLGRYTFASDGTPAKQQDSDNYTEVVSVSSCQELESSTKGNTPAKNLGDFVTKTKANGGYYIAKYEASYKDNTHCYSKKSTSTRTSISTELKSGMLWNFITQSNAATVARNSFTSNYIESDLINSYCWDTAIIFIQKYSEYLQYSQVLSSEFGWGTRNTGETKNVPDKVCNIYDMASNLSEWSSEYCGNEEYPGTCRGRTVRGTLSK